MKVEIVAVIFQLLIKFGESAHSYTPYNQDHRAVGHVNKKTNRSTGQHFRAGFNRPSVVEYTKRMDTANSNYNKPLVEPAIEPHKQFQKKEQQQPRTLRIINKKLNNNNQADGNYEAPGNSFIPSIYSQSKGPKYINNQYVRPSYHVKSKKAILPTEYNSVKIDRPSEESILPFSSNVRAVRKQLQVDKKHPYHPKPKSSSVNRQMIPGGYINLDVSDKGYLSQNFDEQNHNYNAHYNTFSEQSLLEQYNNVKRDKYSNPNSRCNNEAKTDSARTALRVMQNEKVKQFENFPSNKRKYYKISKLADDNMIMQNKRVKASDWWQLPQKTNGYRKTFYKDFYKSKHIFYSQDERINPYTKNGARKDIIRADKNIIGFSQFSVDPKLYHRNQIKRLITPFHRIKAYKTIPLTGKHRL